MKRKRKVVYLDTETIRISDNVEGDWDNIQSFGVSIAVLYLSHLDMFGVYHESSLRDMTRNILADADVIVGFNIKKFDYQVLIPYSAINLYALPTFDIFEQVEEQVGSRVSLNNISSNTLGIAKNGESKNAPNLYWQAKTTELANYCIQDVEITRQIFRNGVHDKYIDYYDRDLRQTVRLDTTHWVDRLKEIITN